MKEFIVPKHFVHISALNFFMSLCQFDLKLFQKLKKKDMSKTLCMWSVKPKIFTIWPFPECLLTWPLRRKRKNSRNTHLHFENQSKFKKKTTKNKKKTSPNKNKSVLKRKTVTELNNILVIKVSVLIFLD